MEIKKIIDYVNRGFIASDYLRAPDIYYYMDLVIDDINDRLNAKFPTFTEWKDFVARWNAWVAGPQVDPDGKAPDDRPEPPEDKKPPIYYPQHNHPHPVPGYPHLPIERIPRHPDGRMLIRDAAVYDAFPDKYLRSVVALGVATKFYTRDEEGESIALDYQNRYEMELFKMTRDYHIQVPWYFQDNEGGFIDFSHNREEGPRDLVPRGMVLRGSDTRIL